MELKVKRLTKTSRLPEKAHIGDLGYDVFADESKMIESGDYKLISTGISINCSSNNYGFLIKDRSSMACKGLFTHAGVIDCFSEDTLIKTLSGEKKIKDINIDDVVFSYNEEDEVIENDVITKIISKGELDTIMFITDNGDLTVTPDTEVYTDNGIKLAKDITIEDNLIEF